MRKAKYEVSRTLLNAGFESHQTRIKFTAFRLIYYKYYRIRIMRKFVTS
jgi:hypothetical protein